MKPFEVLVVGGSEYNLKITTANAVELEEQIGTDLLKGLEKLAEIGTLAKYYFAAAKSLNDNIKKIDDVYQLFDDYLAQGGSYDELQTLIIDVLVLSGILTEKSGESFRLLNDAKKKMSLEQMEKLAEVLQKLSNGDTKTLSKADCLLPNSGT
jgi:hypothetical protein